ncbi:uncharacterized protein [Littorina saxatilis]|uniref:uncharacterized protein n=1 Tax=Littorina saxatilis TaxID=31220 RepID=UPI0038B67618
MRITLGDGPDILDCFRNETQSQPVCTIYNPRFQSDGLVDDQLSLVIKNTTRDLQGLYVLRVAFNNTQYAVSCNLEFLGTTGGTTQHGGAVSNVTLIAAITPSILVLCCALGLLFIARKRIKNGKPQERQHPESIPLNIRSAGREIPTHNGSEEVIWSHDECGYIDWDISRREETTLLLGNTRGTFLVKRNQFDTNLDVLAVNFGEIAYFMIKKEGGNFVFSETGTSFNSLTELLEHYKAHEIRNHEGNVYGKLTYPCRRNLGTE